MLIPMEYQVKDGVIPDSTTEKTCRYCQSKFAVPSESASQYQDVCEGCKDEFDKEIAAASAALMKSPTDAAEAIKKALGK